MVKGVPLPTPGSASKKYSAATIIVASAVDVEI